MSAAATTEFPFVNELPKRDRSRFSVAWDKLRLFHAQVSALTAEHGALVPMRLVPPVLNISNQRVCQLCDAGKLHRFEVGDVVFISEASIVALAKTERKAGRPFKVHQPTVSECAEIAKLPCK